MKWDEFNLGWRLWEGEYLLATVSERKGKWEAVCRREANANWQTAIEPKDTAEAAKTWCEKRIQGLRRAHALIVKKEQP